MMSKIDKISITPSSCRAARGLLALSQEELARHVGIARLTVANFERGRHRPTQANLRQLQATFTAAGVDFVPGGAVLRGQAEAPIAQASAEARLADTLRTLQANAQQLRRLGVRHVSVFGSLARGEARRDSDIDLLVDLDPESHLDLLDYADIVDRLRAMLAHDIDVARRDRLKPHVAAAAFRDEIRAF
jgi:predicted nucleotidyltransferase/DNA-binding XRE family transcriptional regulator